MLPADLSFALDLGALFLIFRRDRWATAGKRQLSDYMQAFAHFGGLQKVFHTRSFGRHALVNDSVHVYKVSHFNDLLADYKSYFKADYKQIYTGFPAELWAVLLSEKIQVEKDDLVIELYQSWKIYWQGHPSSKGKDESLLHFNAMAAAFQAGGDLLETAQADAQTLIPVIALTVKHPYTNSADFFVECVHLMTQKYVDQIGDGLIFVKVGPEAYPDDQTYFIYTVDEEF